MQPIITACCILKSLCTCTCVNASLILLCRFEICVYLSIALQEILDADDKPLTDRSNQTMVRDIVQFVSFQELMRKSGENGCVVCLHAKYMHMHSTILQEM